MLEELLQLDQELFLYLNRLGTDNLGRVLDVHDQNQEFRSTLCPLVVLVFKNFGTKRTLVVLVVALLITCTDQLSNFFKYGIGRLRPCHDPESADIMRLVKSYCGGKFGYFSAHAANSFAPATFFALVVQGKG